MPNLPGVAPGQRTNIELWAARLPALGWDVELLAFEDPRLHEVLYRQGHAAAKVKGMTRCYWRHLQRIRQLPTCDLLLIYREAALIGPALLERLAARTEVPLVYDLDDPLFLKYRSPTNAPLNHLKFRRKVHTLFRLADHVIANSQPIGEYAARYNPAVTVIPMLVDIERYVPTVKPTCGQVRLVWIGSHTTMSNLTTIAPALERLHAVRNVSTRVIGSGEVALPGVQAEFLQWSADTEVNDIQSCHIGLVPLPDLPWNPWKFFYKTLQYMAAGLPVVARRMGSNTEVVQDGVNGFLVESQDEWYERMLLLVDDAQLRASMGAAARATVVERYSVQSQVPRVASLLNALVTSSEASS